MQLLAAVEGDGSTPISEALVQSVPRIRRGMTAVVITASLDRGWVKPLATLRSRGVACVVVAMDVPAFERRIEEEAARKAGVSATEQPLQESTSTAQQWRALRHALAEFDIKVYRVGPKQPLAEALAS
jgi:predicted TIM-barrel fold metal-dependent hydrolase